MDASTVFCNAVLCNAVTERRDSEQVPLELQRANLFVFFARHRSGDSRESPGVIVLGALDESPRVPLSCRPPDSRPPEEHAHAADTRESVYLPIALMIVMLLIGVRGLPETRRSQGRAMRESTDAITGSAPARSRAGSKAGETMVPAGGVGDA